MVQQPERLYILHSGETGIGEIFTEGTREIVLITGVGKPEAQT